MTMNRLFDALGTLPSMPKVVQSLIVGLNDENVELGSLSRDLRQDPTLSARVLRLANSSYYGSSGRIGSIDDAVAMIGLNALRTLVVTSGVMGALSRVPGMNLNAFWTHALLTAGLAGELAPAAGVQREVAYSTGLMHRIGQLLIALGHPDVIARIERDWRRMPVGEVVAAEHDLLGFDHCAVGAELARRWHFPSCVHQALRHYADPMQEGAGTCAGLVHLAAQIALGCEDDEAAGIIIGYLPAALWRDLGLQEASLLLAIHRGAALRYEVARLV
ncbi:HDOD domain-containing protein [Uliginosibacterium sp. H1]|uniref:HDOD domain-containing protein n=1 Tax=Uliginosibacterium sp. H1 TaxID=3114757 RepID=UPI002E190C75|nr:HDOD domain-containing protein [Uliginosibacterium sp. H1]